MSLFGLLSSCLITAYVTVLCWWQSADKNYKRLTCTQSVGLKHANLVISVNKVHKVTSVYYYVVALLFLFFFKVKTEKSTALMFSFHAV